MFDIKQYLGVPIFVANSPAFGVLGLMDRTNGEPISADVVRRAETLAANVAIALQSLHLRQISEENKNKAENLVGLAMEMGSSLSLSELLRILSRRASKMMGARGAAVGLCHEATRSTLVETMHFDDRRAPADPDLRRAFSEAMSEYASTHTDSIYCGSADRILNGRLKSLGWSEVLIARLLGASGELLGFLCLADYASAPDDHALALLNALIGHASIALENARLFSRIAQSNKQWAELFDSITDHIVVHSEDAHITRVNRPFAENLKVRPQDLVGMRIQNALRQSPAAVQNGCPLCQREEFDEFVSNIDGKVYLLSTSKVKAPWEGGLQVIHVLRDVSERREAERRYQELFNTVQEGVYFSTPEGRFIDVNDALVRMLGYSSKEEVLSLDIEEHFYIRREERQAVVESLRATGRSSREVVLRRKSGASLYALENSVAVRDNNDRIVQYRGLVLDITEAKSFQIQLQRQRDFNTQILNNTQSLILVSDTAGLISYTNRRCLEATGYASEKLLGHRLDEFIAEGDLRPWKTAFEKTLSGVPVDNVEMQIRRNDGSVGRFSVNMSPMRGDKDLVNSLVIVMTDITELSNMQAKLVHTEKMVAVGQLVSGVAHEVNNPLTAIMGFADLMLESPEMPESVRKDLRVIVHEAERTKQIVQNLLSFARQMPKQRKPVDVHDVLRRTVQLRAYDFNVHGIEITERFANDVRPVLGDAHQLQQVFLNILNNAYDAVSEMEGGSRVIEIGTSSSRNCVEITFRDTGPGIANPERIFDPFFTTKEVGKGTGLGLSICYGIVRQHAGEITCGNHPAGGATFTVKLPYVADWAIEAVRAAGANA
jgi:two-component system NtrC family sensor kinase